MLSYSGEGCDRRFKAKTKIQLITCNRNTLRLIVGIRLTNPASLRKDRNVCKEIPNLEESFARGKQYELILLLPVLCNPTRAVFSDSSPWEALQPSSIAPPVLAEGKLRQRAAQAGQQVSGSCTVTSQYCLARIPSVTPRPLFFCKLQFKSPSNRSNKTNSLNVSSPTLT